MIPNAKIFDGKKDPDRRREAERTGTAFLDTTDGGNIIHELKEYRKTTTLFATRMEEEFAVDTIEGLHTGKAGDWLALGQAGELYPIDATVFGDTYEPVDG